MLLPALAGSSGSDVVGVVFRCVIGGSFAFVSLIPYMTRSNGRVDPGNFTPSPPQIRT